MWIARPVIVDLKSKKLMDRPYRLCIGGCNANASAVWHWFNIRNEESGIFAPVVLKGKSTVANVFETIPATDDPHLES